MHLLLVLSALDLRESWGLLLWHIFVMHLSPFLVFEDSAVEDVCRCVSMLLDIRHLFPYYCHVTMLFCGQRCYFRVYDYSWHWCLDSWLVYDCLDAIASNILTSLLISLLLCTPAPTCFPSCFYIGMLHQGIFKVFILIWLSSTTQLFAFQWNERRKQGSYHADRSPNKCFPFTT